ncbi:MAG: lytic murein transglycosylase [Gaiellaceae bacterium]
MRRAVCLLALCALAMPAAAASSEVTFVVVGDQPPQLPSAQVPNGAGSIAVPAGYTAPPAFVQQLSVAELTPIWQHAGETYGIPWHVLAAINKIESNFGENMGPSSAGAVGWMQFMPSTWLSWGVDADGDGVADPWDPDDAIYAAARYLAAAGGTTDISRGLFAYNHAQWYVDDVLELAAQYAGGPIEASFASPGVATSVDVTLIQQLLAELGEQLAAATAAQAAIASSEQAASAYLERGGLLSDNLLVQKRATLAGLRLDRATSLVNRLRADVEAAEQELAAARAGILATPFGFSAVGAVAAASGNYVFPVGGGPGTVFVAATHHDYPAADIAAPMGAPLFAHTDGIVVRSWASPEGRCGIGFTMQAGDGRQWTYCHLSYLEPTVASGAALAVGTPVGLVGSTGTTSTGPHLHLQLSPPVSYPQAEPWFAQFAGTAFSWQGASPPTPEFTVLHEEPTSPSGVVLFTKDS